MSDTPVDREKWLKSNFDYLMYELPTLCSPESLDRNRYHCFCMMMRTFYFHGFSDGLKKAEELLHNIESGKHIT